MAFIKAKKAQVAPLIAATFPEYMGRTYKVVPAAKVQLSNLNWCEGTRSQYRACTLAGEATGNADKHNMTAPWKNGAEGIELPLPVGAVVVEHCYFQGKDMGLTFYVNPADMPKLLAA